MRAAAGGNALEGGTTSEPKDLIGELNQTSCVVVSISRFRGRKTQTCLAAGTGTVSPDRRGSAGSLRIR